MASGNEAQNASGSPPVSVLTTVNSGSGATVTGGDVVVTPGATVVVGPVGTVVGAAWSSVPRNAARSASASSGATDSPSPRSAKSSATTLGIRPRSDRHRNARCSSTFRRLAAVAELGLGGELLTQWLSRNSGLSGLPRFGLQLKSFWLRKE